jgi:hypothetical protein
MGGPRVTGVPGSRGEHGIQEQRGAHGCAGDVASPKGVERAILDLLLFEPGLPMWAREEIVREIGDRVAVEDSLWRLHRAGLIHRVEGGFVFASRAAVRAAALLDPESDRAAWTRG